MIYANAGEKPQANSCLFYCIAAYIYIIPKISAFTKYGFSYDLVSFSYFCENQPVNFILFFGER